LRSCFVHLTELFQKLEDHTSKSARESAAESGVMPACDISNARDAATLFPSTPCGRPVSCPDGSQETHSAERQGKKGHDRPARRFRYRSQNRGQVRTGTSVRAGREGGPFFVFAFEQLTRSS